MKKHIWFLPLFLLVTFIFSCQKEISDYNEVQDDFNLENFLSDSYFKSYNANYNPLPLLEDRSKGNVIERIKKYYADNPKEAQKTEAKYGIPVYSNAVYNFFEEINTHILLVGMAKKNSKLNDGLMYVVIDNKNNLSVYLQSRNEIDKLPKKNNAKKNANGKFSEPTQSIVAQNFIIMDHLVFQNADCTLAQYVDNSGVTSDHLESRYCTYEYMLLEFFSGNTQYLWNVGYWNCPTFTAIPPDYQGSTSTTTTSGGSVPTSGSGTYTSPVIKICDNEFDQIIIEPSFLNCPKMKCVYDHLNRNQSDLFCKTIGVFDANYDSRFSTKPNLYIKSSEWNNGDAWVSLQPIAGSTNVEMVFNKFACNSDDYIALASTLLHEGIHARWRYDFINAT